MTPIMFFMELTVFEAKIENMLIFQVCPDSKSLCSSDPSSKMSSQNTDPAAAASTAALKGSEAGGSAARGSVTKR